MIFVPGGLVREGGAQCREPTGDGAGRVGKATGKGREGSGKAREGSGDARECSGKRPGKQRGSGRDSLEKNGAINKQEGSIGKKGRGVCV